MTVYSRVSVSLVAVSVTVTVSFTTVLPEDGSFATSAVPPVISIRLEELSYAAVQPVPDAGSVNDPVLFTGSSSFIAAEMAVNALLKVVSSHTA